MPQEEPKRKEKKSPEWWDLLGQIGQDSKEERLRNVRGGAALPSATPPLPSQPDLNIPQMPPAEPDMGQQLMGDLMYQDQPPKPQLPLPMPLPLRGVYGSGVGGGQDGPTAQEDPMLRGKYDEMLKGPSGPPVDPDWAYEQTKKNSLSEDWLRGLEALRDEGMRSLGQDAPPPAPYDGPRMQQFREVAKAQAIEEAQPKPSVVRPKAAPVVAKPDEKPPVQPPQPGGRDELMDMAYPESSIEKEIRARYDELKGQKPGFLDYLAVALAGMAPGMNPMSTAQFADKVTGKSEMGGLQKMLADLEGARANRGLQERRLRLMEARGDKETGMFTQNQLLQSADKPDEIEAKVRLMKLEAALRALDASTPEGLKRQQDIENEIKAIAERYAIRRKNAGMPDFSK